MVKRSQSTGLYLLLAGVAGVLALVAADIAATDRRVPVWAWLLAWGTVLVGLLLIVAPPVRGHIAARTERLTAVAAMRAAYRPPDAQEPVYNEGRWWLMASRGSASSSSVRCQVFDPLGRSPSRTFAQSGSDPVIMEYPNDFGIERPLPSGTHSVVWTLGTGDGGSEEARASFTVQDDNADLVSLREDLLDLRAKGQALLDEVPPADFDDWDGRGRALYQELRAYFEHSPHLGKPEAMALAFFHEEAPPIEAAQMEIGHFLERIDALVAQFGGRAE